MTDIVEQLRAEIERLREHLATNDRILDHVRGELAKDSALVDGQRQEIEQLRRSIEIYLGEISRQREEIDRLQRDLQVVKGG